MTRTAEYPFGVPVSTGDAPPITDTPTGLPPLTKLASTPPTDEEIEAFAEGILTGIGGVAQRINVANGWEAFTPDDFPKDINDHAATHKLLAHVALIHSEASEATEAVRKLDKANFEEELADVLIRALSIAYGLGLDLDLAVVNKLKKNLGRAHRHGMKAI